MTRFEVFNVYTCRVILTTRCQWLARFACSIAGRGFDYARTDWYREALQRDVARWFPAGQ